MYFECKKKRGWWGVFFIIFFSSHRNVSQTLVTFSLYWLIIITISSSQHVLIQAELRRRMREDRHVPTGCGLLCSKHWGAGPQQKRTRKRTVRFEGHYCVLVLTCICRTFVLRVYKSALKSLNSYSPCECSNACPSCFICGLFRGCFVVEQHLLTFAL